MPPFASRGCQIRAFTPSGAGAMAFPGAASSTAAPAEFSRSDIQRHYLLRGDALTDACSQGCDTQGRQPSSPTPELGPWSGPSPPLRRQDRCPPQAEFAPKASGFGCQLARRRFRRVGSHDSGSDGAPLSRDCRLRAGTRTDGPEHHEYRPRAEGRVGSGGVVSAFCRASN